MMAKTNNALKKARKEKGYTLENMAKILGYKSKVSYYYIENNVNRVTLNNAYKISQILGKPIEELFANFFTQKVQETQTKTTDTNPNKEVI